MASKLFYSLDETAQRLGMSRDEVTDLVTSGQLEEFKDENDQLIFKVAQVDLLAGDDGDDGEVELDLGGAAAAEAEADTDGPEGSSIMSLGDSGDLEPLSLASSDTGSGGGVPASVANDLLGEGSSAGGLDADLGDSGSGLAASGLGESGPGLEASGIGLEASGSVPGLEASSAGLEASGIGLEASGSVPGLEASSAGLEASGSVPGFGELDDLGGEPDTAGEAGDQTGVSIFDPDGLDEADPAAQTQITADLTAPDFDMDAAASGSGLYDFTGDADDSLISGTDLLEDAYGADDTANTTDEAGFEGEAAGAGASGGGSALFESVGEEPAAALGGAAVPFAMPEAYDGPGSGLSAGAALGATVVCLIAFLLTIASLVGANTGQLVNQIGLGDNAPIIIGGGGLGLVVIFTIVGWLLLRKTG